MNEGPVVVSDLIPPRVGCESPPTSLVPSANQIDRTSLAANELRVASMKWSPLGRRLSRSLQKNIPVAKDILLRRYPLFVFGKADLESKEIPVFCFHRIEKERFELQLQYLAANGYETIGADEFYEIRSRRSAPKSRRVLLTIDDGHITLWTVAYPLLQKYGLKVVSFIVPGMVQESSSCRPNLEDVAQGRTSNLELQRLNVSTSMLCNWREIQEMHKGGCVDFQSHTMFHNHVFVAPKIVDFVSPESDLGPFANIPVPTIPGYSGEEPLPLGSPIYESLPRMSGNPRFFDDPSIRAACVECVQKCGGLDFFSRRNWRSVLRTRIMTLSRRPPGRFEDLQECRRRVFEDLLDSRTQIETKLSNKLVRHLCYPWYTGNPIAIKASSDAGFVTNFWGTLSPSTHANAPAGVLNISRIPGEYVSTLPGKGRNSLGSIIARQIAERVRQSCRSYAATRDF